LRARESEMVPRRPHCTTLRHTALRHTTLRHVVLRHTALRPTALRRARGAA